MRKIVEYINDSIERMGSQPMKRMNKSLAFILSLCMVITMIPGFNHISIVSAAEGTEHGTCTISTNTNWPKGDKIAAGATITIDEGATLTINGVLNIDNVTINGSGTLKLGTADSYIQTKDNASTISNITIEGNPASGFPAIALDTDLSLENVELTNHTTSYESVVFFNKTNLTLSLKGNTAIYDNKGLQAAIYAADSSTNSKVQLSDSVRVYNNLDNSNKPANIDLNQLSVSVKGILNGDANVGIHASAADILLADTEGASEAASAVKALFVDDFHNYGTIVDGNNVKSAAKVTLSVNHYGNGEVTAVDAHGRSIVSSEDGSVTKIKEVPGKALTVYYTPDSEIDFVKSASIKDASDIEIKGTANLEIAEGIERNKKHEISSMPTGHASGEVYFDRAITEIALENIDVPYSFTTIADNIKDVSLAITPSATATATITSIAWYDNMDLLPNTTVFAADKNYSLKVKVEATDGSKFASAVSGIGLGKNFVELEEERSETVRVFTQTYKAQKQDIKKAVADGTVVVDISSGTSTYDGEEKSPSVVVKDKNGGNSVIAYQLAGETSSTDAQVSYADEGGFHKTIAAKTAVKTNAGSYSETLIITNNNYASYYTTTVAFAIDKRSITPSNVIASGVSPRIFDGSTTVQNGVKVGFTGAVTGDEITYDASYNYSNANVEENKQVNVTGITLTGDSDVNYELTTNSLSGSIGKMIIQARPIPTENSITWSAVTMLNTSLSSVNFRLATNFVNEVKQIITVPGTLNLLSKINPSEVMDDSEKDSEVISRNEEFQWRYVPTDTQNYKTVTGTSVLWPAVPIERITFGGITKPVKDQPDGTTISAIEAATQCGPSDTSRIIVNNVRWDVTSPELGSVDAGFGYGDSFGYNRIYTLTISVETEVGDEFKTAEGGVSACVNCGGTIYSLTRTAFPDKYHATFTFEAPKTGYGDLTTLLGTATSQEFMYDGNPHSVSFTPALLGDSRLQIKSKFQGESGWTDGLVSRIDVTRYNGANSYIGTTIQISHPDYRVGGLDSGAETCETSCNLTITPKPITNMTIANPVSRPYDGTDLVDIEIYSTDICDRDSSDNMVTFGAIAHISDKNVTTGAVSISASSITIGGERAVNYVISPASLTAQRNLLAGNSPITKATPTGGTITYAAIDGTGMSFSTLNVHTDTPFINPNAPSTLEVPGIIKCYTRNDDGSNKALRESYDTVQKFEMYNWVFEPTDSQNYNTVSGTEVFWPGAPIATLTVAGITAPVATAEPTSKEALAIETPEISEVTVAAVNWFEEESWATSRAALDQEFRYNRVYTVVMDIQATAPDTFDESISGSGVTMVLADSTEVVCSVEYVDEHNIKASYTFETPTEKGVLNADNLDVTYFNSYDRDGTLKSNNLTIEEMGGKNTFRYVYSGRTIKPAPRTNMLQNTLAEFTYAVGGSTEYGTSAPAFTNVAAETKVTVKMTHNDYDGHPTKDLYISVQKCNVRPEGVDYAGKSYDATTNTSGAHIIWMPQDSTFELGTASAISEDVISYTANYSFSNADCEASKTIVVSDIDADSQNFNWTIDESVPGITKLSSNSFRVTMGELITRAIPVTKNGTILNSSGNVPVGTSFSALNLTTDCSITNGSIMKNPNRTDVVLPVYGKLGMATEGGIRFMTEDELNETAVRADTAYLWRFEPADTLNYEVTTGSQILYVTPPPVPTPPSGGGGGGMIVPPPPATTQSGVISTPGAFASQIHVYLMDNGKQVNDKYYLAEVTGEAITRALKTVPGANVVVDANGNVVIKAIIKDGSLKAYLIGDNYLTLAQRKSNYIDVPGYWFETYVDFCSNRGLVNGTGEGKFSPNDTLTRGMAATIFYRLEGSQKLDANARWFADVEKDQWYSDGIAWAGGQGIVNGIGVKNFAPFWSITRQELAVMTYNYCRIVLGAQEVSASELDRSMYYDSDEITYWAEAAIAFCAKNGLMTGDEDGNFCPKATATRAEFSTIMQRLIEGIVSGTIK